MGFEKVKADQEQLDAREMEAIPGSEKEHAATQASAGVEKTKLLD